MDGIKINFPEEVIKHINLQCNGLKHLYECPPEVKGLRKYFDRIRPAHALEIGAGIGRVSVFLRNYYNWDDTTFYLLDGDSGNKQVAGINTSKDDFYNSLKNTKLFCNANNLSNLVLLNAAEKINVEAKFDLVYSFLSIGFHWPLSFYLDDIFDHLAEGCVLVFGVRSSKEKWYKEQIDSVPRSKYLIVDQISDTGKQGYLVLKKK